MYVKHAFVDLTTSYGGYRLLVDNATLACRNDYDLPDVRRPWVQTLAATKCSYNVSKRYFYEDLTAAAPGTLLGLPAAASATSGQANVIIGQGYALPATPATGGQPITGMFGVSFSSATLSAQLAETMADAGGAVALVFEVATTNVIAASWRDPALVDFSEYNTNVPNPQVYLRNLTTLDSNAAMRAAIDRLGGSAVLARSQLPAAAREAVVAGHFVSVRDVNAGGVSGLALRVVVAVPVSPDVYATMVGNRLSDDIAAVAGIVRRAMSPGQWSGVPNVTLDYVERFLPELVQFGPLVNQIIAADTSLMAMYGKHAFVDLTTSYGGYRLLVDNATLACRNDYDLPDLRRPWVQTHAATKCSYNVLNLW